MKKEKVVLTKEEKKQLSVSKRLKFAFAFGSIVLFAAVLTFSIIFNAGANGTASAGGGDFTKYDPAANIWAVLAIIAIVLQVALVVMTFILPKKVMKKRVPVPTAVFCVILAVVTLFVGLAQVGSGFTAYDQECQRSYNKFVFGDVSGKQTAYSFGTSSLGYKQKIEDPNGTIDYSTKENAAKILAFLEQNSTGKAVYTAGRSKDSLTDDSVKDHPNVWYYKSGSSTYQINREVYDFYIPSADLKAFAAEVGMTAVSEGDIRDTDQQFLFALGGTSVYPTFTHYAIVSFTPGDVENYQEYTDFTAFFIDPTRNAVRVYVERGFKK